MQDQCIGPPTKVQQDHRQEGTGKDSDVDMVPMRTNKSHKPNSAIHRSPPIHTQSQDARMECCPTALDPLDNNPSQVAFDLQGPVNEPADSALEPSSPTKDSVAANVGDPRLVDQHILNENDTAANVGDPRLAPAVPFEPHVNQPTTTSNSHETLNHDASDPRKPNQKNDQQSKACQRARVNPDAHATGSGTSTIRDFLAKNAAYRPIDNGVTELNSDDDIEVVHADDANPSIESILCQHEHSRDLVQSCREIIAGWPKSFAHADIDFFAQLATCYLIQFPSFMCYAVTAMRVLTHAPWGDDMFHGHIRELVLCAVGNGWTWTDQTTTVQRRRISTSEVCAAFASYSNQSAFPPGQIADLDTAIIAVCDDLYPGHAEIFFSQFNVTCRCCQAVGRVSVPLFDTMLCFKLEDNTIDLHAMLMKRDPRLALDRDDVGFSHATDCSDHDQLSHDESDGCLTFTLKIMSPIEQLPPIDRVLDLLHKPFNVPSLSQTSVSHSFVLTGILVVQLGPPHHFLVIESFRQEQVLLYDNLQGYKWVHVQQIKPKSLAWGFIFRRHDQQPTSFQPEQYKAIAPVSVSEATQTKASKASKASKATKKPPLGINANRYRHPPIPKKTLPEHSTKHTSFTKELRPPDTIEAPPSKHDEHLPVPLQAPNEDQRGSPSTGSSFAAKHCGNGSTTQASASGNQGPPLRIQPVGPCECRDHSAGSKCCSTSHCSC